MAAVSATRGARAGRTRHTAITRERYDGTENKAAPVPDSRGPGGTRRSWAERSTHAKLEEPLGPKGRQSRQPSPSKQRPADDKSPDSPNEGPGTEADVLCPPVHGDGGGAEEKKKLDSVFGIYDVSSDDEAMGKQADKGNKLPTFAEEALVGVNAKAPGSGRDQL